MHEWDEGMQCMCNFSTAVERCADPVTYQLHKQGLVPFVSLEAACCSGTMSSASVKLDVDTSPSLPSSGLPEACDIEALLRAKAPILGLSTCCAKDCVRGTASPAPAACLTKALKPRGLKGLRRERAGACVGASSGAVPDSKPDVLLKDSPELSVMCGDSSQFGRQTQVAAKKRGGS